MANETKLTSPETNESMSGVGGFDNGFFDNARFDQGMTPFTDETKVTSSLHDDSRQSSSASRETKRTSAHTNEA